MNELKIEISQEPAVIRCNFEDVKAKLSEKMAEYQGAVFTEESKSVAKAELASLRKTREEVEKRRKEVKSQCLAPYNDFETKVKELLEIIDEPICLIDSQLKEMEAERMDMSGVATVVCITVVCYLVGMMMKATEISNKWIPCAVGVAGAVLGVVGMYTIPDFPAHDVLNAVAVGIVSGLASTGANQIIKQAQKEE